MIDTHEVDAPSLRRSRPRLLTVVGAALMTVGMVVLGGFVFAPDVAEQTAERLWGGIRQGVQAVDPATPQVHLGGPGGVAELDAARGEFVEMTAYEQAGLQPTYAAHNGYGGDVILPWALGQQVDVVYPDGSVVEMIVTDARDVPKHGSTTAQITGLAGTILLQSCYWGDPDMRFVALTPASEEPTVPDVDGGDAPLWDGE